MSASIRAVVDIMQEQLGIDFEEAVMRFYKSQTYITLQNTENAFWAESAEYIAERYFEEMESQMNVTGE